MDKLSVSWGISLVIKSFFDSIDKFVKIIMRYIGAYFKDLFKNFSYWISVI